MIPARKPDQHYPFTARETTARDLASALSVATSRKPFKARKVVDDETGEVVGHIARRDDGFLRWYTASTWGRAETRAEALREMAEAVILERAEQAKDDTAQKAIDALPEPIRTRTITRNAAALKVERERNRTVLREDDLRRAEAELEWAENTLADARQWADEREYA